MRPLPAFKKTLAGLIPANDAGRIQLAKVKPGQTCVCDIRRPRSIKHHNKLFALLQILVDNTEAFATTAIALKAVKAALGRGHWVKIPGASRELFVEESIAFESMAQTDFEAFYNDAVEIIRKYWLPTGDEELRQAVEGFLHTV